MTVVQIDCEVNDTAVARVQAVPDDASRLFGEIQVVIDGEAG